jgi:hypothetical protein
LVRPPETFWPTKGDGGVKGYVYADRYAYSDSDCVGLSFLSPRMPDQYSSEVIDIIESLMDPLVPLTQLHALGKPDALYASPQ